MEVNHPNLQTKLLAPEFFRSTLRPPSCFTSPDCGLEPVDKEARPSNYPGPSEDLRSLSPAVATISTDLPTRDEAKNYSSTESAISMVGSSATVPASKLDTSGEPEPQELVHTSKEEELMETLNTDAGPTMTSTLLATTGQTIDKQNENVPQSESLFSKEGQTTSASKSKGHMHTHKRTLRTSLPAHSRVPTSLSNDNQFMKAAGLCAMATSKRKWEYTDDPGEVQLHRALAARYEAKWHSNLKSMDYVHATAAPPTQRDTPSTRDLNRQVGTLRGRSTSPHEAITACGGSLRVQALNRGVSAESAREREERKDCVKYFVEPTRVSSGPRSLVTIHTTSTQPSTSKNIHSQMEVDGRPVDSDIALAELLQCEEYGGGTTDSCVVQKEHCDSDFAIARNMQQQYDEEMAQALQAGEQQAVNNKQGQCTPEQDNNCHTIPADTSFGSVVVARRSQHHHSSRRSIHQAQEPADMSFEALSELEDVARGLSQSAINRLTNTHRYTPGLSPKRTCNICLCEYEQDQVLRVLHCQHFFHRNCVDKWLESSRKCPVCTADVCEQKLSRN